MTDNSDIITYFLRVVDVLERDYYVRMPKTHQHQGVASFYCANYINKCFADDLSVADAAFVLCNKIQKREWEDDPINPPVPALGPDPVGETMDYLTPPADDDEVARSLRIADYLSKFHNTRPKDPDEDAEYLKKFKEPGSR